MMGGLEITFKRQGVTVLLLTFFPQIVEAFSIALGSFLIFKMSWPMNLAFGFCLAAVSPAVLVPSVLKLHHAGFGVDKGISQTLIAASSFDDIIAISMFGILIQMALDYENIPIKALIANDMLEILAGLVLGLIIGVLMYCLRCVPKWLKAILMTCIAGVTPYLSEMSKFPEGKFACVICFGYICSIVWEHKPSKELEWVWMVL